MVSDFAFEVTSDKLSNSRLRVLTDGHCGCSTKGKNYCTFEQHLRQKLDLRMYIFK